MARTPEGPPPPPAVQKLRVRYAKRGRLRFSSTRDFQRALERALRRAAVPMAFSAGFHPHPKISYANAAPTGTASEAEYVEISVTHRVDPDSLREALDEALPVGLDVLAGGRGRAGRAGRPAAGQRLGDGVPRHAGASRWRRRRRLCCSGRRCEVTRMMKSGPRTFDVRSAVVSLSASAVEDDSCAILRAVVRHTTPAVRPDDVLTALHAVAALAPPTPPLVTRLAQGPLRTATATVADPLAADQDADGI